MQARKKQKLLDNSLLILGILMVARFSCIVLSNIPLLSMGFVFIYGLLFAMLFVLNIRYLKKQETIAFMFLVVYILEVFVITFSATDDLFNTHVFNAYIMLFLFLIYLFLKRLENKKTNIIYMVVIIGFVFTYIYSIVKLIRDPLLSRKAASAQAVEENVDVLGAVGGFDTVYGSLLVMCVLLYIAKSANKAMKKIFTISVIAICCVFLVMASYGTALVLMVLLFALWIFQKNRWMGFLIIIAGIFLVVFRENIGLLISRLSEHITYSSTLSQKVDQIGEILQTGESTGTLAGEEGRLARMGWSWNAFKEYPIFGGFGKSDVQIGCHSELFDTFGRFGIVGAISLFTFLGLVFRDIYAGMKTTAGKKCCLICMILYGAVMILNPALYTQQLLPIFVLLPLYEKVSNRWEGQRV